MMKEVIRSIDAGILPVIGLVAFLAAFTLIVIRVATMRRAERDHAKFLPLEEPQEIRTSSNHDD